MNRPAEPALSSPPSAQRKAEGGTLAASIEEQLKCRDACSAVERRPVSQEGSRLGGVLRPLLGVWGSRAPFSGMRCLLHGRALRWPCILLQGVLLTLVPCFTRFTEPGSPRGGGYGVAAAGAPLPERGASGRHRSAPHSWMCSQRASPSACALGPRVTSACSLGTRFPGRLTAELVSVTSCLGALCKAGDSLRLFLICPVAEIAPPHLHPCLPSFPCLLVDQVSSGPRICEVCPKWR